jgi:hypothetical protein
MIKFFAAALAFVVTPALAAEPDGLTLPPGFHASVVAEGLGADPRAARYAPPTEFFLDFNHSELLLTIC